MKKTSLNAQFERLEELSRKLESGDVDLEDSTPMLKEGLDISKFLRKRLSEIENEIKEVTSEYFKETENDLDEASE